LTNEPGLAGAELGAGRGPRPGAVGLGLLGAVTAQDDPAAGLGPPWLRAARSGASGCSVIRLQCSLASGRRRFRRCQRWQQITLQVVEGHLAQVALARQHGVAGCGRIFLQHPAGFPCTPAGMAATTAWGPGAPAGRGCAAGRPHRLRCVGSVCSWRGGSDPPLRHVLAARHSPGDPGRNGTSLSDSPQALGGRDRGWRRSARRWLVGSGEGRMRCHQGHASGLGLVALRWVSGLTRAKACGALFLVGFNRSGWPLGQRCRAAAKSDAVPDFRNSVARRHSARFHRWGLTHAYRPAWIPGRLSLRAGGA